MHDMGCASYMYPCLCSILHQMAMFTTIQITHIMH